jgi:LmbE family N-acetylglucosaminyl deacetylase
MTTAVFFHAHPDDESMTTAGTMAKAAAAGHRVVMVTATRGEHGEVPEGFLSNGESLRERRERELAESCRLLSVARHEYLGYVDSGMMGTPENDLEDAFWRADVEDAARRLAGILDEESADVVVIYDENGTYGHPDHIQVHRVGKRAAELAATPNVFMATINRDHIFKMIQQAKDMGLDVPDDVADFDPESFGVPESRITTAVDVLAQIDLKMASMRAHASQIPPDNFLLTMPAEAFAASFGVEWYVRLDAAGGGPPFEPSLFDC